MKIVNPAVTLADEARRGVEEEVRSGFLEWLFQFSMTGDDGELYSVGGSILSMAQEKLDVVSMTWTCGGGRVDQLPQSIYKITRYPGMKFERLLRKPAGTLTPIFCPGNCTAMNGAMASGLTRCNLVCDGFPGALCQGNDLHPNRTEVTG